MISLADAIRGVYHPVPFQVFYFDNFTVFPQASCDIGQPCGELVGDSWHRPCQVLDCLQLPAVKSCCFHHLIDWMAYRVCVKVTLAIPHELLPSHITWTDATLPHMEKTLYTFASLTHDSRFFTKIRLLTGRTIFRSSRSTTFNP